jgi:hypothetical protein
VRAVIPWVIIGLHSVLMAVDEFVYHRKRGLPRWERIGHPLDTLSVIAPTLVAVLTSPESGRAAFLGLSVISCFFVTKDEAVHARECPNGERFLHAFLFILHPCVLWAVWMFWTAGQIEALRAVLAAMIGFGLYQTLYWNFIRANQQ